MIATRVCRTLQFWGSRCFSCANAFQSGHNRWSKIKHDKAKEDASTTKQRSAVAEELRQASKAHGPDLRLNARLADIVTKAKKIGFPKSSIESAIARGQGVSLSGTALENMTIEAIVPPSVAVIIECQTDSKLRTLSDMRLAIKESGGSVTPTGHLFERKGRIICERPTDIDDSHIFDLAIEAGATDVEIEEDGDVIVLAESSHTTTVANALQQSSDLKVKRADIIWDPREDMMVDVTPSDGFDSFLDRIHEDSSVQDIYTNIR